MNNHRRYFGMATLGVIRGYTTLTAIVAYCGLRAVISQNIALGKPAGARGDYPSYPADRAVDGELGPASPTIDGRSRCTFMGGWSGSLPRWWVDLQDTYRVHTIIVYNTDGTFGNFRHLTNFILSVGPSLTNLTNCGPAYRDPAPPAGSYVNITCDQVGRFVVLRKQELDEKIVFCEVEVYGTLRYDCSVLCSTDPACTITDGCTQCPVGTRTPECTACDDGTYGVNCVSTCGRCLNTACDKVTGVCPDGCQLWRAGDKCNTAISVPNVTNETIRIPALTNSSVVLEWDPLYTIPGELAEFYKYAPKHKLRGGSYQAGPLVPHGPTPLSYEVTGLLHNTLYDFTVDTYRVMRDRQTVGPAYPIVSTETRCNTPDAQQDWTTQAGIGTTDELGNIIVMYQTPDATKSGCDDITSILIEYKHENVAEFTQEPADISSGRFVITPAASGEYEVRIVVINNQGLSAVSPPQTVTVIETRPDPPNTTTSTTTTTTATTTSPSTLADTATSTTVSSGQGQSSNKVSDTVIIAVAVVVAITVIVIVVTVLVLRHRRMMAKRDVINTDSRQRAGTQGSADRPPGSKPQAYPMDTPPSDRERPANRGDEYEVVDQSRREPEPTADSYQTLQHGSSPAQPTGEGEYAEI